MQVDPAAPADAEPVDDLLEEAKPPARTFGTKRTPIPVEVLTLVVGIGVIRLDINSKGFWDGFGV